MTEGGSDGFSTPFARGQDPSAGGQSPGQQPGLPGSCGSDLIERVGLFPLANVVLFPGAVLPLHVFEQRYRAMTADALGLKCSRTCAGPMDGRKLICMCRIQPGHDPMHDQPPIFEVGCLGQIMDHEKLADGRYNLLIKGLCRVKVGREYPLGEEGERKPYRRADLHPIACGKAFEIDVADAREKMKTLCRRRPIEGTPVGKQLEKLLASEVPTVQLADVLAFDLVECIDLRQQLLEETDERRRVEQLVALMEKCFPEPGSLLAMGDRFDVSA